MTSRGYDVIVPVQPITVREWETVRLNSAPSSSEKQAQTLNRDVDQSQRRRLALFAMPWRHRVIRTPRVQRNHQLWYHKGSFPQGNYPSTFPQKKKQQMLSLKEWHIRILKPAKHLVKCNYLRRRENYLKMRPRKYWYTPLFTGVGE